MTSLISKIATRLYSPISSPLLSIQDILLTDRLQKIRESHANPINQKGAKVFSQSDEDGIIHEIVKRIGIEKGSFVEFGVENGLENNTLALAAIGWHGFWVGGEELAFESPEGRKFRYYKEWVHLDNIIEIIKTGLKRQKIEAPDLISMDLDGNDIYFVEEILKNGISPKIFVVEYSSKFIVPIRFQIKYDAKHRWMNDDYFGASLCSFVDLFGKYNYSLVCCNAQTGANAFFIKNEYLGKFADVPRETEKLYEAPKYQLFGKHSHKTSPRTARLLLEDQ